MEIAIAIVDDHRIVREGLVSLFKTVSDITVADTFDSGMDLLIALETGSKYGVILLDMHMPIMDGVETVSKVLAKHPDNRVLMHTMSEMVNEIEEVVHMGVRGYILKTAGLDELLSAIRLVANGGTYFSASILASFINSCTGKSGALVNSLSTEQMKVIIMYCAEDKSLFEIGEAVHMNENDVKQCLVEIKKLLKIKSDLGLGRFFGSHSKEFSSGRYGI